MQKGSHYHREYYKEKINIARKNKDKTKDKYIKLTAPKKKKYKRCNGPKLVHQGNNQKDIRREGVSTAVHSWSRTVKMYSSHSI